VDCERGGTSIRRMLARMTDTPHDEPDEIPPLLPPDQMPPVTDQLALHRTWRALMGELGFAGPQLWVLHLGGDGRPLGVVQIDDVPARLDAAHADLLVRALGRAAGDGVALAFLFARPGRAARTPEDLTWATGLARACRTAGVRSWPVHLANDREITVVAPEDLADAG
jgi:hypothetical protein